MQDLADEILIKNVKEKNCSDSLEVLIKRHSGMFFSMAKRYSNTDIGCSGVSLQDFEENKPYIVYQAAKSYEPEKKTKFVTWLGNQVRYYCLNTITAQSKYVGAEEDKLNYIIDSVSNEDLDVNLDIQSESKYVLDILDKLKDNRIKKIFRLRYFSENKKHRSFTYIAKKLGMSTQGVIDLHNNFISFIKRKISSKDNMDDI